MSIWSALGFGGRDPRILKDARVLKRSECAAIFAAQLSFGDLKPRDQEYLALTEDGYRRLLDKYWDHLDYGYGSNGPEFPDCDDFADLSFAAVTSGAIEEGMRQRPAYARTWLKKSGSESSHEQNPCITNEQRIVLFEPQTGGWSRDLSAVERVVDADL